MTKEQLLALKQETDGNDPWDSGWNAAIDRVVELLGAAEPPAEQRPTAHLLTVATDVDSWTARCSCGAWKTEVTRFGRVEDWPPDQTLVDLRTWHDRHVQHPNREAKP